MRSFAPTIRSYDRAVNGSAARPPATNALRDRLFVIRNSFLCSSNNLKRLTFASLASSRDNVFKLSILLAKLLQCFRAPRGLVPQFEVALPEGRVVHRPRISGRERRCGGIHGTGNHESPRRQCSSNLGQIGMSQNARNEIRQRMAVHLRVDDTAVGTEAAREIYPVDSVFQGAREQRGNSHRPERRDRDFEAGARNRAQTSRRSDDVGHALPYERLSQNERPPGVVFFRLMGALISRRSRAELRPEIADPADVGGQNGNPRECELLREFVFLPDRIPSSGVEKQECCLPGPGFGTKAPGRQINARRRWDI